MTDSVSARKRDTTWTERAFARLVGTTSTGVASARTDVARLAGSVSAQMTGLGLIANVTQIAGSWKDTGCASVQNGRPVWGEELRELVLAGNGQLGGVGLVCLESGPLPRLSERAALHRPPDQDDTSRFELNEVQFANA